MAKNHNKDEASQAQKILNAQQAEISLGELNAENTDNSDIYMESAYSKQVQVVHRPPMIHQTIIHHHPLKHCRKTLNKSEKH